MRFPSRPRPPLSSLSLLVILSHSACCYRSVSFFPTFVPRHPCLSSFLHEGRYTPARFRPDMRHPCITVTVVALPPLSTTTSRRRIYRLGIATMQPIFRRNYHLPSFFYSVLRERERGAGGGREGNARCSSPGTRLRNVAP